MSVNPSDRRSSPSLAGKINDHETRITSVESRATSLESRATALEGTYNPGWFAIPSTLTYASADAPTFVITAPSDATTVYTPGIRMRLVQTQALTSVWHMENNSVDSIAAHNGSDTAITYSAGNAKFGSYGAGFNGSTSKITLVDHADLKPTGPFTIGAWVKTSSSGSQHIFQSKEITGGSVVAGIYMKMVSGKILLYSGKNTGITQYIDYNSTPGGSTCNDGNWHFVVGTWDGSWLKVYIDGVLDNKVFWSFAPVYAVTNYPRIGVQTSGGSDGEFFSGSIDDVFLINGYALGETNIKDIYDTSATMSNSYSLTKYFIVTKVSSTSVTVYGGTDYVLTNGTITSPYIAGIKAPNKFPLDPAKWSVEFQDRVQRLQSTPTAGTWYNIASLSFNIPIGAWNFSWSGTIGANRSSSGGFTVQGGFSTASNAETDPELTAQIRSTLTYGSVITNQSDNTCVSRSKDLLLTTKTTFYQIIRTRDNSHDSIIFYNDETNMVARARCSYL